MEKINRRTRRRPKYLFLKALIFTVLCFVLIAAGYLIASAISSLLGAL